MAEHRLFAMEFAKVYPLYVAKAEVETYLRELTPELAGLVTVCGAIKSLDSGEVEWME